MNNKKNIVISIVITLIVGCILVLGNLTKRVYDEAGTYYQVYLKGKQIGVIESTQKLYDLIDKNQSEIKKEYNVNSVYPPTNLKIIPTNSFVAKIDNVDKVYQTIEEEENFTIKGYVVSVKGEDKSFSVNVLDKNVFYEAAKRFVKAFLDEDEYEKYINNNQKEIVELGRIIEGMRFAEDITIKEAYINVNDKIYTDELELSQFLLFGENPKNKSYTVKVGDTIASVSDANELNVEEFLMANPNYKSVNTILRVGDKVNVTLIAPQLTFVYDLYEVAQEQEVFMKETKEDPTKPIGTKEIIVAGVNGLNRITERYSVTNGEREQGVEPIQIDVIKKTVNQVTLVGTKKPVTPSGGGGPNNYVDQVNIEGSWGWPTNRGYVITSGYTWRWGRMHNGIDISGVGFGSLIYAAGDGVVLSVHTGCPNKGSGVGDQCGGSWGNSIVIQHANGYYSGSSSGAHLHFSAMKGNTYTYFNPMKLYQ